MQLTGTLFSDTLGTSWQRCQYVLPDYPVEIRALQASIGGVSGFRLHYREQ